MTYFKNKSFWFWGFIILLLINVSVLGSMAYVMNRMNNHPEYRAFHHKFKKGDRQKQHKKSWISSFKGLNLDEKQKSQLEQVHKEHTQTVRQLKSALKENHQSLFEEVAKPIPDSSLVQQYKDENIKLHTDIMEESIVYFTKMNQDLNPEQQQVLKDIYLKKMKRSNNPQKK